ncbi:ABC transporter ATP-binding protein [Saccharopolyspora sp. NPDC050389]|uniref:ABC transporter ATP-binding protein n=1 Tax=Saccharopolyspora sp. NPDC050389 TaxID=3155516 RepID=UPI0033DA4CDA
MARVVSAEEIAPTTYAAAIRAEGLRVRAGLRMAVNGLDLSFGTGVHGLLGPNGAGKTTLMRALATVVRPAGGTLELLGQHIGRGHELRQVRRRLGYLPQNFGFYRRFTLREFTEYMAWLKEVPKQERPGAVQRAIELVGLADRADHRMRTLSGGMLRRAGIAQAIVNDPEILLLDEPTAGLDPEQRLRFRELLHRIGQDTCVLVSTHLVEDVAAVCADVTLVDHGRLVFRGTRAELVGAGDENHPGDSPAERGYSALLAAHRGDSERRGGSW